MDGTKSAWGMTDLQSRMAHDIGDIADRLVDLALDQRAWREPSNTREAGAPNKPPASNHGE